MRALRGLGWGFVVGAIGGFAAAQALAAAISIYWAIDGGAETLPMAIFLLGFFGGIVGASVGAAIGAVLGMGLGGLGRETDAPLVTASLLVGSVVIATVVGSESTDNYGFWLPVAMGASVILAAIGWWAGTLFHRWTLPPLDDVPAPERELVASAT